MQATTPPQQSRTTLCWTVHAKEPVFALVAGPNGLVGLGCKDCVLLLTQAHCKPHGVTMERLPGGGGPFTTICFMGSTMVATGSSGMLYAWDTQTKAQRASKRLFPGKASGDRIKDWVLLSGLTDTRLAAACCDLRYGSRCCTQPARRASYPGVHTAQSKDDYLLMGKLCLYRQVLIVDENLEIAQKLDGLPECSTVYSLDWVSDTVALVCTDKACVYWNLTEEPPKAHFFGDSEQQITSAACSKDLERLCIGTANGHVRDDFHLFACICFRLCSRARPSALHSGFGSSSLPQSGRDCERCLPAGHHQ